MIKNLVFGAMLGLASCIAAPATASSSLEAFECTGTTPDYGEHVTVMGTYDSKTLQIIVGPTLFVDDIPQPFHDWTSSPLKEVKADGEDIWMAFALNEVAAVAVIHPEGTTGKTVIEIGHNSGYKTKITNGSCNFSG